MKPSRSILDRKFRYVPSVATSVADTWKRFGWRPRQKPVQALGEADERAQAAPGLAARRVACA